VEVRTLGVGYDLKTLLPHGVSLITSQEQCDWHRGGVSEAAPTQGSEGDLCRLLDSVIYLNANDGCYPWLRRVEGYSHADLALVHTMDHRHASLVDRNIPL
jgi:hypothetical protein